MRTQEVLDAINEANPSLRLTDDNIRRVIRMRQIPAPRRLLSGLYDWTAADIQRLADWFKIEAPPTSTPDA